jgi:uncharacterized phage protein (TIGR01671 family)
MRELKFRAWDESQRYMAYQGTPDLETIQSFMHHFSDKELMQFTGLSDKFGKDIYEGDIIGDWFEVDGNMEQSRQTVYFDERLGGWMLDFSFNQDRTISVSLYAELADFNYEVLGNIYENIKS